MLRRIRANLSDTTIYAFILAGFVLSAVLAVAAIGGFIWLAAAIFHTN